MISEPIRRVSQGHSKVGFREGRTPAEPSSGKARPLPKRRDGRLGGGLALPVPCRLGLLNDPAGCRVFVSWRSEPGYSETKDSIPALRGMSLAPRGSGPLSDVATDRSPAQHDAEVEGDMTDERVRSRCCVAGRPHVVLAGSCPGSERRPTAAGEVDPPVQRQGPGGLDAQDHRLPGRRELRRHLPGRGRHPEGRLRRVRPSSAAGSATCSTSALFSSTGSGSSTALSASSAPAGRAGRSGTAGS